MKKLDLINDLSLKKLDIEDTRDLWLIKELDKEKNGFFYPIENLFYYSEYRTREYLKTGNLYNAPLGIFNKERPIGYLEMALLEKLQSVTISCEILQAERKKGYGLQILREVTKNALTDKVEEIKKVLLVIDLENRSRNVAVRAGFRAENLSKENLELQGFITYEKTEAMLKLERKR